jgi:hypothetical protein
VALETNCRINPVPLVVTQPSSKCFARTRSSLSVHGIIVVGPVGHRWAGPKGKIGFYGGKIAVHRPRVRSYGGHEVVLPTWVVHRPRTGLAAGQ